MFETKRLCIFGGFPDCESSLVVLTEKTKSIVVAKVAKVCEKTKAYLTALSTCPGSGSPTRVS